MMCAYMRMYEIQCSISDLLCCTNAGALHVAWEVDMCTRCSNRNVRKINPVISRYI